MTRNNLRNTYLSVTLTQAERADMRETLTRKFAVRTRPVLSPFSMAISMFRLVPVALAAVLMVGASLGCDQPGTLTGLVIQIFR